MNDSVTAIWTPAHNSAREQIAAAKKKLDEESGKLIKEYNPLKQKLAINDQLKRIDDQLGEEKKRLILAKQMEQKKKENLDKAEVLKRQIVASRGRIHQFYATFCDVINAINRPDDLIVQSLPLDRFVSVSAEEALPNAIGLLLRLAVADGRVTDSELLRIQPALEGRLWQPGLDVKVGDVYTFGAFLWRCLQDHTTQGTWTPDLVPALWRKVEIISEDAVRVWAAGIDYIVGDEVA